MVVPGHGPKVPIVHAFEQSTRVLASLAYRLMVASSTRREIIELD